MPIDTETGAQYCDVCEQDTPVLHHITILWAGLPPSNLEVCEICRSGPDAFDHYVWMIYPTALPPTPEERLDRLHKQVWHVLKPVSEYGECAATQA